MQVVEHHQQVLIGGSVEHRARDRLPGPNRDAAVAVGSGTRRAGRGRARGARWPTGRAAVRPRPGSSGRRAPWLPRGGGRGELGTQAALADPGLAGHHREHRLLLGLLEQPDERGELVVAADQGRRELLDCAAPACAAAGADVAVGPLERRGPGGARRSAASAAPRPGSSPSSSASSSRTWRSTSRASACRPERVSARARRPHSRSRNGYVDGQHLELAGHHRVPTEPERRDGPVLERHRAQLLEPGALGLGCRCVLELGVGQPAPQREPLVERANSLLELRRRRGSEVMAVPSRWCAALTAVSKRAASSASSGRISA